MEELIFDLQTWEPFCDTESPLGDTEWDWMTQLPLSLTYSDKIEQNKSHF